MVDFEIPADNPAHAAFVERPKADPVTAIVDAALEILRTQLPPQMAVERFPNKPADYDFQAQAAALVIYDGSKFDAAGNREDIRLVVSLLVRSLDGDHGAYPIIQAIRLALHDQSLAGATGTRPVEVELEAEADGVFRWRLVFAASLPAQHARVPRLSVPRGFSNSRP